MLKNDLTFCRGGHQAAPIFLTADHTVHRQDLRIIKRCLYRLQDDCVSVAHSESLRVFNRLHDSHGGLPTIH